MHACVYGTRPLSLYSDSSSSGWLLYAHGDTHSNPLCVRRLIFQSIMLEGIRME